MIQFTRKSLAAAVAALVLGASFGSCTLSDPDSLGDPTVAKSMRLASVSTGGWEFARYIYDDRGRIVNIFDDSNDMTFTMYYEGTSELPSSVRIDEDGMDYTIWSSIEYNADGSISRWRSTEYVYDDIMNAYEAPDISTQMCRYDSDGQLTYCTDGDEPIVLEWKDGDMVKFRTEVLGISEYSDITVEYCDLENESRRWGYQWMPLGVYATTGLFGKAPKHFPVRFSGVYQGEDNEAEFAYKLNNFGLIALEKMVFEGETMVYQYNYR